MMGSQDLQWPASRRGATWSCVHYKHRKHLFKAKFKESQVDEFIGLDFLFLQKIVEI